MRFFLLIVLLFASSAAALTSDSGIFDDNNNVKTAQAVGSVPTPATAERRLARGTPIKRDTNAARMRRGLSPLPPTRRAAGHCTCPFGTPPLFAHVIVFVCSEASGIAYPLRCRNEVGQ
jgi:hypothetical protein